MLVLRNNGVGGRANNQSAHGSVQITASPWDVSEDLTAYSQTLLK